MAKLLNIIKTLDECYTELKKDGVTLQSKYNFIYKNKTINTTLGRIWFNLLLPDNYPEFVDRTLNKSELEKVIYSIYDLNTSEIAADCISNMQREAFKLATFSPVTFSKDSFVLSKHIENEKKKELNKDIKIEEYADVTNKIAKDFLAESKDIGLKDLINSKTSSKMNVAALAGWLISKGPVMDVENHISKPIKHALIDGYTGEEYYIAAAEARRGNYIKAVSASDPGTLARHVVFALANVKLTQKDCKTKKYLTIMVTENIFKNIQGRYYLNERLNKLVKIDKSQTNIINTMIKLRSPLYCKDPNGICPICYGETSDFIGTDKIGMITGAIINAVGVQGYAMKARHAATSVSLQKCDFTKDMKNI